MLNERISKRKNCSSKSLDISNDIKATPADTISVNHTLVNYDHRENNGGKKGCYFNCHSPKTKAGVRTVPMMDFVKDAFEKERAYQEEAEIHCTVTVDGYTDFIFVNRFGECQHQGTLNKAIWRIIQDCNDEVLAKNPNSTVLLPRFSCHIIRLKGGHKMAFKIPKEEYINRTFRLRKELVDQMETICNEKNISLNN